MGFKLFPSRADRIEFITSLDDAVDTSTEEAKDGYRKYLDTLDQSTIVLNGEPTVFRMRPLAMDVYEIACRDAQGVAIRDLYTDTPTARQLFRLSVEDVEPWPEAWGDKDAAFRFEYKRKVLGQHFIARMPAGACREAAKLLLDTLPLPESRDKEADDEAVPFTD